MENDWNSAAIDSSLACAYFRAKHFEIHDFNTSKVGFLNTRKTTLAIQELQGEQLECRLRSKSSPNGNETTPQTQDTITLHRLGQTIQCTIVNFGIRGLIHQIGTNAIKGTNGTRHEKPRHKGGTKGRTDIFAAPSRGLCNITLGHVVTTHFRGIQYARS